VARVAVVGVPSERWGEVDELPVSDTGKVRRADLVEMATAEEATT